MRRTFCLSFLLASLAAFPAGAQRDFADVEIRATHVAGNVYLLEGSGGNIGVSLGEDGILLVDDQFAPLAGRIRKALKKLGGGKLRFVLNTHWHGDHTGGNQEFGREAPIIAHANVRRRLASGREIRGRVVGPSPREALPVVTFEDSVSLHFNGEEVRIFHVPRAHTDGDIVVFFTGSNVVHTGDLLFADRFPFVDLESGGDVEHLAESIGALIRELPADVRVIPGHGPLTDLQGLRRYHGVLLESIRVVAARLAEGKSPSEIQEEGLPESMRGWSWHFVDAASWLETVTRSLSRPAAPAAPSIAPRPRGRP